MIGRRLVWPHAGFRPLDDPRNAEGSLPVVADNRDHAGSLGPQDQGVLLRKPLKEINASVKIGIARQVAHWVFGPVGNMLVDEGLNPAVRGEQVPEMLADKPGIDLVTSQRRNSVEVPVPELGGHVAPVKSYEPAAGENLGVIGDLLDESPASGGHDRKGEECWRRW